MPSKELLRDLRHLSNLANTTLAIVSGLSRQVMEQAFKGLNNIWLFAETGYYMRRGAWARPDMDGQWIGWMGGGLERLSHMGRVMC